MMSLAISRLIDPISMSHQAIEVCLSVVTQVESVHVLFVLRVISLVEELIGDEDRIAQHSFSCYFVLPHRITH